MNINSSATQIIQTLALRSLVILTGLMLLVQGQAQPSIAQSGKDARALLAKAQTQGTVRVIVGLRTSYQPEGRLHDPQAIQTQRSAIGQAQNDLLNQMANRNVKAIKKFAFIPHMVVEVDAATLAALSSASSVTSIEEDRRRRPSLMESVPLIGAPTAWASGYIGAGQVVAILDTGVDKTHPFLSGKVVSEACYSTTNPTDTATSLCPGGVSQSTDPDSGLNCNVTGICIHGTHVAGIAAGRDNGSIGFSGVAKDAKIVAIQVFSFFSDCACLRGYDSDILSALERVQVLSGTYSIAAANLSLGGEAYSSQAACDAAYPAYKDAIDNLRSLGIATIIASGNDYLSDSLEAPGCISSAISVGSTQDGSWGSTADAVSSFSNSASFLNLLAPGQYIYSSVPGGGFQTMMGTSMATPHVTGGWAILKSRLPSATVDQVLSALTSTGISVTDSRNGITKPRIRVNGALYALVPSRIYFPLIGKDVTSP